MARPPRKYAALNLAHLTDAELLRKVGTVVKPPKLTIAARIEQMKKTWCACGNPSGETTFHADNSHPDCAKHHYRCNDCGKITQIG